MEEEGEEDSESESDPNPFLTTPPIGQGVSIVGSRGSGKSFQAQGIAKALGVGSDPNALKRAMRGMSAKQKARAMAQLAQARHTGLTSANPPALKPSKSKGRKAKTSVSWGDPLTGKSPYNDYSHCAQCSQQVHKTKLKEHLINHHNLGIKNGDVFLDAPKKKKKVIDKDKQRAMRDYYIKQLKRGRGVHT